MDMPETRYAKSGNVHIAYQIAGSSDLDMVLVPYLLTTRKVGGNCRQPPTEVAGQNRTGR